MTLLTRRRLGALALLSGLIPIGATAAEVKELRISQQFGIGSLPLQVARHQGLFEKQAKAHGLDGLKVTFVTLGGGTSANDALLSNSVDIAAGGVGPFLTVWDKTRGAYDVKGVAAVSAMPIALVTTNPAVRTLADFTDRDRIALPSVNTSIQAVTLQIAAEKVFGPGHHEQLDAITVSMKRPDAYAALASGRSPPISAARRSSNRNWLCPMPAGSPIPTRPWAVRSASISPGQRNRSTTPTPG